MRASGQIVAVSFDVGGTLIEPWPSVGHVYAQVAAEAGFQVDPAILTTRFTSAWKAKAGFDYSAEAWLKVVERTFAGLLPAQQRADSFFEQLYARFTEGRAWRVYDDVSPTLAELSRLGLRLAAISNWDRRLRPLLQDLGLDACFHTLAISGEVGFQKPAREIFDWTLERLGVPPNAVLHVGDSRCEDWEGARGAGLKSVLLRRGVVSGEEEISSLLRLVELVKASCSGRT